MNINCGPYFIYNRVFAGYGYGFKLGGNKNQHYKSLAKRTPATTGSFPNFTNYAI